MKSKPSIWQRMGLHDWFLAKEPVAKAAEVYQMTPDDVYRYIVEKFHELIGQLSFANRIVFFHEYIICFNPEDYSHFMDNKKGIFGLIIQELLRQFYATLKEHRAQGKVVEASSNKWVFRFVSHPDYKRGDKSFTGKLLPGKPQQKVKEENLRVTFIPRQTGIAETFDINPGILQDFNFYSDGYYEVPYQPSLVYSEGALPQDEKPVLARFETIVPDREYSGKKIEYLMRTDEILVTGKEDPAEGPDVFKIPSDWVNAPHLRIRFNRPVGKFYLASFGEKTILNENEVAASGSEKPHWVELPVNSRMVLNGIVGINIFKL